MMLRVLSTMALLGLAAGVHGEGLGVAGKAGTLGAGLDLVVNLTPVLNLRANANGLGFDHDIKESDIDYAGDVKLRTAGALLDWHPNGGGFRLSGGVYWNGNEVDVVGRPAEGGTIVINGVPYTAADVGSLTGKVDFNSVAPYLGIGYGVFTRGKPGWSFVLDVGVLFQGKPRVALSAACGPAVSAAQCDALQNDVAAEEAQLRDDLDKYQFYPVVGIGIGYQF